MYRHRIKFRCSSLALLLLVAGAAPAGAALYAYDGYIHVNDGGGNTTYAAGSFNGSTFNLGFGQSLLFGGTITADAGNGEPAANGPEYARMFYVIDNGGVNSINLPLVTDYGTSGWKGTFTENSGGMVDLGSGLTVGNHTVSIWFLAHDNNQPLDAYFSNNGANFNATLSVSAVPEPVTTALGLFAAVAGVAGWSRGQFCRSKAPAAE